MIKNIPIELLDWMGSICVVISLIFLIRKNLWYWHFSNLSLLPYFLLFLETKQLMLAGLQISYLIFGIHGFYLWILEHRREHKNKQFNEVFWYNLGWVLTLLIFIYTVAFSQFKDEWVILQFIITSLSLLANWATTRKWIWSWYVWIIVNGLQAFLFHHLELWAQFGLQAILAGMSIRGIVIWSRKNV